MNALLQMQRTDPFCKCISKRLLNGKAPHHEVDTFTHMKGLLYKHVSDAGKQFPTLVIPKSWKDTVLVEAHNKLLSNKKTILFERDEQRHYKIHCKLHPLPMRKSKSSAIPITND